MFSYFGFCEGEGHDGHVEESPRVAAGLTVRADQRISIQLGTMGGSTASLDHYSDISLKSSEE